jgi:hypothetical protein
MVYIQNDFPTSIQDPVVPTANDEVASFDHAGLEEFQNESIKALKDKVGANSSAVTTSHDYKLSEITSTDKAVGETAVQTIENKTLTTPRITNGGFIADNNGNEQIEFETTTSAVNHIGVKNGATGSPAIINAKGSDTNISLRLNPKGTGSVELGTANLKFPNTDGANSNVLSTDGNGNLSFTPLSVSSPQNIEVDYLELSEGAKAGFKDNNSDIISSNDSTFAFNSPSVEVTKRTMTSDWASASAIRGYVVLGDYIYISVRDASNNYRVYRYLKSNISAGGTLMTISGQAFSTTGGANVRMTSNGTDFFFNHKAGNSANDYVISRYTISGTTLTYVSDITCGSSSGTHTGFVVDTSINIFGMASANGFVRKYNSSGTLQYTTASVRNTSQGFVNFSGDMYVSFNTTGVARYTKVLLP